MIKRALLWQLHIYSMLHYHNKRYTRCYFHNPYYRNSFQNLFLLNFLTTQSGASYRPMTVILFPVVELLAWNFPFHRLMIGVVFLIVWWLQWCIPSPNVWSYVFRSLLIRVVFSSSKSRNGCSDVSGHSRMARGVSSRLVMGADVTTRMLLKSAISMCSNGTPSCGGSGFWSSYRTEKGSRLREMVTTPNDGKQYFLLSQSRKLCSLLPHNGERYFLSYTDKNFAFNRMVTGRDVPKRLNVARRSQSSNPGKW